MIQNQVCQNIRVLRIKRKLSQSQMAIKMNIVTSGYGKIERGKTQLTIDRLGEIASIFNIVPEYILSYHKKEVLEITRSIDIDNMDFGNVKEKIKLYEYLLSLYKFNIEGLLFGLYYKASLKYPEYPMTFKEYISEPKEIKWLFELVKSDIADYKNDQTFEPPYSMSILRKIINFSDKELKEYLSNKANYESEIFGMMYYPHSQTKEDAFRAFKDIVEDPNVLVLFVYGLVSGTWFNDYWTRYKSENKELKYKFATTILSLETIEKTISNLIDKPILKSLENGASMSLNDK